MLDIVKAQLCYWAQISAAGALSASNGMGLLTVGLAASVYTITMPANFTVPLTRRFVALTVNSATARQAQYDEAASANNTVIVRGFDLAVPAAADVGFQICIYRVMDEIGPNVG